MVVSQILAIHVITGGNTDHGCQYRLQLDHIYTQTWSLSASQEELSPWPWMAVPVTQINMNLIVVRPWNTTMIFAHGPNPRYLPGPKLELEPNLAVVGPWTQTCSQPHLGQYDTMAPVGSACHSGLYYPSSSMALGHQPCHRW